VNHLLGDRNGDGIEDDIVSSNLFIGKSLTEAYNYEVTGMWQQGDKDKAVLWQASRRNLQIARCK
jgi:hypothetical protein